MFMVIIYKFLILQGHCNNPGDLNRVRKQHNENSWPSAIWSVRQCAKKSYWNLMGQNFNPWLHCIEQLYISSDIDPEALQGRVGKDDIEVISIKNYDHHRQKKLGVHHYQYRHRVHSESTVIFSVQLATFKKIQLMARTPNIVCLFIYKVRLEADMLILLRNGNVKFWCMLHNIVFQLWPVNSMFENTRYTLSIPYPTMSDTFHLRARGTTHGFKQNNSIDYSSQKFRETFNFTFCKVEKKKPHKRNTK